MLQVSEYQCPLGTCIHWSSRFFISPLSQLIVALGYGARTPWGRSRGIIIIYTRHSIADSFLLMTQLLLQLTFCKPETRSHPEAGQGESASWSATLDSLWFLSHLVSYHCSDKWPYTYRLKIIELFSPSSGSQKSGMAFTGLKSRCQWDCDPPGSSVPCLFHLQEVGAFLGSWLHHLTFASIITSLSLLPFASLL